MQGTASLIGLSVVTIFAGWAIQALQPSPADNAARHYGLILVDNPVSEHKMKHRQADQFKAEGDGRIQAVSSTIGGSDGLCIDPLRCKIIKVSAE
jgi:hypothetical protein